MKAYVKDVKDARELAAERVRQKRATFANEITDYEKRKETLEQKRDCIKDEIRKEEEQQQKQYELDQAQKSNNILENLDENNISMEESKVNSAANLDQIQTQDKQETINIGVFTENIPVNMGFDETTDPEEIREFNLLCKKNELKIINTNIEATEDQIDCLKDATKNATNKVPYQPIMVRDENGETRFEADKTEEEVKNMLAEGFEHHQDNQERIALNEMVRESGQDLTTMINNRDSQTMDDSE